MANVDNILEECVEEVLAGRSTVDECLAAYPQYADALRPLLQAAVEIEALDRLEASPVAFQAGKRLMMEAVAQKGRDRATSAAGLSQSIRRYLSFLQPTGSAGAKLAKLALVGALGAATVLVWLGVAGLLLRSWYGAVVPQTCVVADASGIAQVQSSPGGAWQPLATGWVLESGHRIRTGNPANVTVRFFDGSTTSLGADSELLIAQVGARRDSSGRVVVVQQVAGTTHNRVESQQDSISLFQIETPSASIMVHGTEFKVRVNPDHSSSVVVIEGEVTVTGQEVTIMLTDGQATMVQVDQAPGPVVLAPLEELVEGPSGGEPSPQVPETQASAEPSAQGGGPEPGASPGEPAATNTAGAGSPEPSAVTETASSTSEPVGAATPTVTPKPPAPTATQKPPAPTATRRVPTSTATPKPPTRTATPKPPTPTGTPEPPPPTATATPSPSEVVEVFQATYKASKEELSVKARTSVPGCTLTLVGFGAMEPEGGHWLYVEKPLDPDDVPSTVTVRSSCGGSGTSPVVWE